MEEKPKIKPCIAGCKHEYQDKTYGKGLRVMNPTKGGQYRCSACGQIQY